jgi:heme exporter protein D
VFTAIVTSAGPHAALWLALAISVFAFSTLLVLFLMQRRIDGRSEQTISTVADRS